jgi:hypothetical protein
MAELEWEELTEVLGSMEAELLKMYFQAHKIELQTFEDAETSSLIPVTFGRVRIYVGKKDAKKARKLLLEYENKTE